MKPEFPSNINPVVFALSAVIAGLVGGVIVNLIIEWAKRLP
jgi:hypothetical protein